MKKLILKLLKTIAVLLGLFIALSGIWWILPARTPKINAVHKNAIASIEFVQLGGIEQCILIRSQDVNNPILLFLHGGPGMPMMYLAHEFQRPLEEHFTVVQWDRRGAGKTFSRNRSSVEDMNVRRIVDDAYALIDTLTNRFDQDRIILVAHSFGTYLGSIMANERPDLMKAFVSVGQVVDDEKARIIQEDFIRSKAIQSNRKDIILALDATDTPDLEKWLFEFGAELKASNSFFPLLWSGLRAPEYTLVEALDVGKGSSFSSAHMKYNVLEGSIYSEITEYQVPVYFFIGTSDFTTPHTLVTEYYELITAPKKDIVYFENSAHFPFFEEPDRFCEEMKRLLVHSY